LTYSKRSEGLEHHVGVLGVPLDQVVTNNCHTSGDEDVSEKHGKLSDEAKGSESQEIAGHYAEGFHGTSAESDGSQYCFNVSVSRDVLNDSFETGSTARETSEKPSQV
jgi:hypothetical protein